jgi:hypothetical protein
MWKAILTLLLVYMINNMFTVYVEKYIRENHKQRKPLLDVGHKFLPNTYKFRFINDIIPLILVIVSILTIKDRSTYATVVTMCIILRTLCIYCTVLPPTHKKCDYDGSYVGGCYDKLFSGHITLCVISSLFLSAAYPTLSKFLFLINIFEAISLIASRDHYTVDVVLGVIISYSITNQYISSK